MSCVEAKKARKKASRAGNEDGPLGLVPAGRRRDQDRVDGLIEELASVTHADAAPPPSPGMRTMGCCPKCDRPVFPDQIVCVECGTNLQSGKKIKTQIRVREKGEAPPPPSINRLAVAVAASAVGAGLGLGLWVAVGGATGFSSYMMVFVVGVLAAGPALIVVRGAGSPIVGIVAGVMAFGVIILGMRLAPPDRIESFEMEIGGNEGEPGNTQIIEGLDSSQASIFDGAWLVLGVLTAMSLGATNPYEDDEE